MQALLLIRLAQWANRFSPGLASVIKYANHVLTGCDVAAAATIGPGLRLYHPSGVVIGPGVTVGADCTLQQHVTLGFGRGGSPTLRDGVFVGPGAVIIGDLEIGFGSYIGANTVITKGVPPNQMWAGNPARFVRPVTYVGL